jgi:hypothetical protein
MCNNDDAAIAGRQSVYQNLAKNNPKVVFLLNFGWWLGTNGAGSDKHPITDLPLTSKAQQSIGAAVLGLG